MIVLKVLKGFDAGIVRAPKGVMGLTKNGEYLVLRDGDMVSLKNLDEKFVSLLYLRGMLTPIKIDYKMKKVDKNRHSKLKYNHLKKKNRASNHKTLDNWFGDRLDGFRR